MAQTITAAVSELEARVISTSAALDSQLDLYNRIVEWTTNTVHEAAALELGNILEEHRLLNGSLTSVSKELALDES